jgi:hypothetical protein
LQAELGVRGCQTVDRILIQQSTNALYDTCQNAVSQAVRLIVVCGLLSQPPHACFPLPLAGLSCLERLVTEVCKFPIAVQLIGVYLYFRAVEGLQHPAGFDSMCFRVCAVVAVMVSRVSAIVHHPCTK